jgi:hydrogenase maturation protein HypF
VPPIPASLREQVTGRDWAAVCELVASGLNSPLTTSAGRLFDAVAAICGIGAEVDYEGQAAAELEGIASLAELGRYPMPLAGNDADAGAPGEGLAILDPRETISALLADLAAGVPVAIVSARFHNALAAASAAACVREARRRDLSVAVLSGGVFQNRLLVERTAAAITREGIRVLIPARLPPNDGGISFGQAAVAAAR